MTFFPLPFKEHAMPSHHDFIDTDWPAESAPVSSARLTVLDGPDEACFVDTEWPAGTPVSMHQMLGF